MGMQSPRREEKARRRGLTQLTLVVWFQLGELRRFSEGEISDSGRGSGFAILTGDDDDDDAPFLEIRNGCT